MSGSGMEKYMEDDCPICLGPLIVGSIDDVGESLEKTTCDHMFHRDCLRTWFKSGVPGTYCPLCKTPVESAGAVPSSNSDEPAWQRRRGRITLDASLGEEVAERWRSFSQTMQDISTRRRRQATTQRENQTTGTGASTMAAAVAAAGMNSRAQPVAVDQASPDHSVSVSGGFYEVTSQEFQPRAEIRQDNTYVTWTHDFIMSQNISFSILGVMTEIEAENPAIIPVTSGMWAGMDFGAQPVAVDQAPPDHSVSVSGGSLEMTSQGSHTESLG